MALSSKKQETRSPSEILYKYLIKAQLPRNTFLDELQEKYFNKILQNEFDENDMHLEETKGENIDWELHGNRLMENISPDIETEEDLEIELNQETLTGSFDRFGNGFGKFLRYLIFFFKKYLFNALHNSVTLVFKVFCKNLTRKTDCASFQQKEIFYLDS